MRSEKEVTELAYAYWLAITDPKCPPFAIVMGMPAVLHALLWVLSVDLDEHADLLKASLASARKAIEDDCIADPLSIIVRDLEARKQAKQKAANAQNN